MANRRPEVYRQAAVFEDFLAAIAPYLGGPDSTVQSAVDFGADLLIRSPAGPSYIVEAKAYTPSTRARLDQIVDTLVAASKTARLEATTLVLAVPGVLADGYVTWLHQHGVQLWDGPRLREAAAAARVEVPPSLEIASGTVNLVKPLSTQFLQRIRRVAPGKQNWKQYQDLCSQMLEYLFHPPLEVPQNESPTLNKVNRRDAVLPNYAVDGTWAFLRDHYRADYIVADAKNYASPIKKTHVLQLANYLSFSGAGLFGMILTRLGADSGAVWTLREQWVLHQKMIVVLADDDLRQMLRMRDAEDDPAILIRQKIEDFRLGL